MPVLSSRRVSTSPAASTARPLIASTLRCTRRSIPAMPIADRRAPIVVGISATSSAMSTVIETSRAGVGRPSGAASAVTTRNTTVRPGDQDVEGDLVGRLAPRGALDQRDHAVEEAGAGLLGDAHDDPVGEHARAAGDRAAVAARLADDRGRLAGDRRLVHRRHALHDVAVARDQVARLADHQVARAQVARRARAPRRPPSSRRRAIISLRVARRAFAWALPRPSATASARLAKITVSHSQRATTPVKPEAVGRAAHEVGQEDRRW